MDRHTKALLEVALQYNSREEFKEANLPKYLLCQRKRLLSVAFPKVVVIEPIKGIYKLYDRLKVLYIGHSTIDSLQAIEELRETIPFKHYVFYDMHNHSDIITLSLYLASVYKPEYNTNIEKHSLTYTIPNVNKVLGKAIKVTI